MPPSSYLASKSYQSDDFATISPGIEVSTARVLAERGVPDHRALDLAAACVGLDDHPRVVAGGELDRLVELGLGAEHPRDPDTRAEPRGLHPERPRHRRRVLAPAGLADLAELDLRQVPEGEQPLADELVHRDRGGEHARPRVGDIERLEQSLDAPVLAERAVQDRKRHVAVE